MYGILRVLGLEGLGKTDRSKVGYFFVTEILVEFYCCDVSHHELTVVSSPSDVVVGVDAY